MKEKDSLEICEFLYRGNIYPITNSEGTKKGFNKGTNLLTITSEAFDSNKLNFLVEKIKYFI